jgi:XTP/dITP diphosphohydrolase
MKEKKEAFARLLTIMDELREKCPWDKKQTLQSLRALSIEELYELSDALLQENPDEIKKELGDLFLHLVFYCKIAEEKNWFDVSNVLNSVCEKLIHRHPHIYGNVEVKDEEEVKRNWEALKLQEGAKSVLAGVPKGLPALVKAWRVQEKARGIGFDWPDNVGPRLKVEEEWKEFGDALQSGNTEDAEMEFGDLMFSMINLARHYGINPDDALEKSTGKFVKRFQKMEEIAENRGLKTLQGLNLEALDELWESAKSQTN